MNTNLLLSASALVMGSFGIAGLFLPQEFIAWTGNEPAGLLPLVVQLLATLLFAFAMINWTARGSLLGGIYNRPVAFGNMIHFTVGSIALTRFVMTNGGNAPVIVAALLYVVFAVSFILVFFRSPVRPSGDSR